MSGVWTYSARDDADRCVSVLLRVHELPHATAPQAGSLLRVLLLRHGRLSANANRAAMLRFAENLTACAHGSETLRRGARQDRGSRLLELGLLTGTVVDRSVASVDASSAKHVSRGSFSRNDQKLELILG